MYCFSAQNKLNFLRGDVLPHFVAMKCRERTALLFLFFAVRSFANIFSFPQWKLLQRRAASLLSAGALCGFQILPASADLLQDVRAIQATQNLIQKGTLDVILIASLFLNALMSCLD